MNNKNRVYAILLIALCSVSMQTYTMSRFLLGAIAGGTLVEARNVGKNIVDAPQYQILQTLADTKESITNTISTNPAPKTNNDFLTWAKKEYSYLEAGAPVVFSDLLNKAQELITSAKEKLK